MLFLRKGEFNLSSDRRLLKHSDVALARSAEETIVAAQAEAKRIREEALKAAEEEKRRGYEKGLADGKMEIAMQKLDLVDSSVQFMEGVEKKMADVVIKAIRSFVAQIGDEEIILQIVRKTMSAVIRTQREITLKVAPELVETVRARVNEIVATFPTIETFNVIADPKLKGVACLLETEAGIADASVETQIAAIEKSLKRHLARGA
ncbi:MAG: HrpE/YscL family type III secretion apparatus protein [Kiritimatiellae bacterium]|nr:HrpE/YscL family type III secretion apparatus protein [Kiritimatiellia bacterium]